ncbi:MAG: hypothetical protein IKU48_01595 [Clostridia bacterium]|nr:hypothetical protein [Clostridia bacterium]
MGNKKQKYSNILSVIICYFAVYILLSGGLMFFEQIYETNRSSILFDVMGIYAIFVCYLYFPIISIDYGKRAFLKNKSVFFPALILFLVLLSGIVFLVIMSFLVAGMLNLDFWGSDLLDKLFAAGYGTLIMTCFSLPISFVVSVVSSIITKIVLKNKDNRDRQC